MTDDTTDGLAPGTDPRFLSKVCGITNLEDARLSLELGANCLGINFYSKSPRFVEHRAAARLIGELPAKVRVIGVVVLGAGDPEPWRDLADRLDAIQVHGAAGEEDLEVFEGRRLLVAVAPSQADRFPNYPVIVDTSWGTGQLASWEEAARIARPFVLSGGLTPENVAEAMGRLRPVGVDVCSGVERAPGRKDPAKLARFLEEVRRARSLLERTQPGGAGR